MSRNASNNEVSFRSMADEEIQLIISTLIMVGINNLIEKKRKRPGLKSAKNVICKWCNTIYKILSQFERQYRGLYIVLLTDFRFHILDYQGANKITTDFIN